MSLGISNFLEEISSLPHSVVFLYFFALIAEEVKVKSLSLCDPMDCSLQAPLSMGCSRQEYWSELPFPSPGDLPDPGMEPGSPALQANSLPSEPPGKPNILLENTSTKNSKIHILLKNT